MGDFKISELDALAATPDDADILAIVDDVVGTPITKKITVANLKSSVTVPVKAIGSELDTGTDDAKFATAKAIKDSHNVPSVLPSTDGKVMTSNGTDWISETPATVPVKATGTEINTGTDDAKFATAKALVDSLHYRTKQTSEASNATPTPTGGYAKNEHFITALAVATATFAAPSGTPLNGNTLLIRITSDASARILAWNAIYNVIGVELPLITVASKTTYVGCKYNSTNSKWDVLAVGQEAA